MEAKIKQKVLLALFASICLWLSTEGAVQSLVGRTWYHTDVQYVYQFDSQVILNENITLETAAKIKMHVISETEVTQELKMIFSSLKLTWHTLKDTITDHQVFGNMEKWFSVLRDETGHIKTVKYSPSEQLMELAIKKSVTKMLSLEENKDSEQKSESGGELSLRQSYTETQTGYKKNVVKKFLFKSDGDLSSVSVTEDVVNANHQHGYTLLSDSLHSESSLKLIEIVSASKLDILNSPPSDLITDSLEINMSPPTTPLSVLHSDIIKYLSCSVTDSNCKHQLVTSLNLLSIKDLTSLVKEIMKPTQGWTPSAVSKGLSLLDALVLSGVSQTSRLITEFVLQDHTLPDKILQRALFHFSTTLLPTKDAVETIRKLTKSKEVATKHKALLTLGAMAKSLKGTDPQLSKEIVQHLHDSFHQETSTSSQVIHLDSIGNAGDITSQKTLHEYARGKATLSSQHAAIRALRNHHDEQTANLLEELAETSSSSSVQHAAASLYSRHPLAKRDLSHILKSSSRRKRRDVGTYQSPITHNYNTTMPSVYWSLGFGDDNISMSLGRSVHNSFELQTDPFSTEYQFTMRDEATFTADLHLSSGQQHNEFLQTDLCLDGTITYNANMAKDFSLLGIKDQYSRYSSVVDQLSQTFITAYDAIISSQHGYTPVKTNYETALSSTESKLLTSSQYLSEFYTALMEMVSNDTEFKGEAINISLIINTTLSNVQNSFDNTKQSIITTLNSVLPSKLQAYLSAFLQDDQPFTTNSFYLPYLPYAPQKALANIYEIYWRAGVALQSLQSDIDDIKELTSVYGPNKEWTNPSLVLWPVEANSDDLLDKILLKLKVAHDTSHLQALYDAISTHLKPALSSLLTSSNDLHNQTNQLVTALTNTNNAFEMLTKAYESTRSTIDTIFGQQVYPGFPSVLKSCDSQYGCGSYPSTTGGKYRNGIDLTGTDTITAPFAGYVKLLDPSSLHNETLYSYNSTNAIVLTPTDFSLYSYHFIIANINPTPDISSTAVFVRAGATLGSALSISGNSVTHLEAYKTVDNVEYAQDPSQFLPPVQDPTFNITWNCNELATFVQGVVVDVSTVSSTQPVKELIGDPLVTIIVPNHEFPQPYDMVLRENHTISSADNIQFFQSSTFLTVGPIPVTFSFTSTGHYQTNISIDAHFLSQNVEVNVTPNLWARVDGSMKVGNALYATVQIQGILVDTTLPLTLNQDFGNWPLVASSTMDLILRPSTLNLTTELIQVTGAGMFAGEEILDSQLRWYYSIPLVNRNEFSYEGTHIDSTPPVFTTLPHHNSTTCYIHQLLNRQYNNPAYELEFAVHEPESQVDLTYRVGTFENGFDVISVTKIEGERIVMPHLLLPAKQLEFTVTATNQNGNTATTSCDLSVYDRSLPLARVIPISTKTSHPNQFVVLVALFDEYGFTAQQEIAIGTTPGDEGHDIVDWQPFDTSLVSTVPAASGLDLYSFARSGRFINHVLSVSTDIETVNDCADICTVDSDCLSFDYSFKQKRCILHDNIEGPPTDNRFPNNFETTPLQSSSDFVYYERLGLGNSTLYAFTNLTLQHRREFYINLKLSNKLGYSNIVSSEKVIVDLTPPLPGLIQYPSQDEFINEECGSFNNEQRCTGPTTPINNHRIIIDGLGSRTVFNGPIPLYDALYSKADNFITANWDGFHDKESGLAVYTWCISSSPSYNCDILSRIDPHNGETDQQYWTNSGLAKFSDLSDGSYYITVDVINGAGYGGSLVTTVHHSTEYIIDTLPPEIDELNIDDYDININRLNISFNVSDSGSGVKEVSVAIGTTPDDSDLLPWTVITTSDGWSSVSANIPDGVDGWVKIQAIDNVNLRAVAIVDTPINVDRTPPVSGTVRDGADLTKDINYQSDTTSICMNWEGFSDPHSKIVLYQWGVGLIPGNFSVVPLQNLTNEEVKSRKVCEAVTLFNDVTYYSTLIVTNGADLVTSVSSNGVTVDTTPPSIGTVYDGSDLNTDIQFSSSLTNVAATWRDFSDPESSIDSYQISIYRRPLGSVISKVIYTEKTNKMEYFSNHYSLSNGDFIHVVVEAFNTAGLSTTASSNGYIIDLSPPLVDYLVDGIDPNNDITYRSTTNSLSAIWSSYDHESNITQTELAVFQVYEGIKTRIYPNPELLDDPTIVLPIATTNYTVNGLTLTQGLKYIVAVTFTNGAGLRATYETNGVVIDMVPPIVSMVTVLSHSYVDENEDVLVIASETHVEARWLGSDVGSGIAEYRVAIVTEDNVFVTSDGQYVSFGLVTGGVISGLNLTVGNSDNGPFYKVRVIAVDNANQISVTTDSKLFWVVGGDQAGSVFDGYIPYMDMDYTDEFSSISAYFNGFFSQRCGGISQYQWAVGSGENDKGSVLPYTDSGIVIVGNGSGYAQAFLPDLKMYESQKLYISFRGITGCGDILESTSNGFTIDTTPPSVSILATGPHAIENSQFGKPSLSHQVYQTTKTFSSVWTVNNSNGNIVDTKVSIGTYPGGSDLLNETKVNLGYIREEIKAPEGVPTYVTVKVKDEAGQEGVAISDPIVLDTSLPPMGEISCSKHYSSPYAALSHSSLISSELSCSWKYTTDLQSNTDHYTISIATDPLDQSRIFSQEIPGNEYSFVLPILQFHKDQTYYVTLYTENKAGLVNILTSDPIYFDETPPINSGKIMVVPNYAFGYYNMGNINNLTIDMSQGAVCIWWSDCIGLRFSAFANENSIKEYQLGIGTVAKGDNIYGYKVIVPDKDNNEYRYTIDHLSLDSNLREPLYFTIRAVNYVGLYTDLTSSPIYIKSYTNIQNSWVYDGKDPLVDIDYQNYTTFISAHLHYGVHCPLRRLEWGVESADGMIFKNFTEVLLEPKTGVLETEFSVNTDQILLHNDETYRIVVRGIDYSGEIHIFRSNGTAVTTRPLIGGIVLDGTLSNLMFQDSLTSISFRLSSFGDTTPEQAILYYEAAIGTDPEFVNTRSDIVPFTNLGLNTSYTFTNLQLVPLQIYYVTVRAHAVSGAVAEVTSNGIIPGYSGAITPGLIEQPAFQSNTSVLSTHWNEFQSDVPILYYEWALSNAQLNYSQLQAICNDITNDHSDMFVHGFENVELSTVAMATSLSLKHGKSYYVVIRVVDQAKKCKAVISTTPTVIDTTPPVGHNTTIGPIESRTTTSNQYIAYVMKGNDLVLSWDHFTDEESPVDFYEVGLFKLDTCSFSSHLTGDIAMSYVNVGLLTSFTFEEIELEFNVSYVAKIRATNKASLTSSILTQPVMPDMYQLTAGTVKDGTTWSGDLVFQSDLTKLSGTLTHAFFQPEYQGTLSNIPCPKNLFYQLNSTHSDWSNQPQTTINGLYTSVLEYLITRTTIDSQGTKITAKLNPTEKEVESGIYSTTSVPSLNGEKTVSLTIEATKGDIELVPQTITSVVFIESSIPSLLVDFDKPFTNPSGFKALGLQLHHSYTSNSKYYQQKIVLWSKGDSELSQVQNVSRTVTFDLSHPHQYKFQFVNEQLGSVYTRKVELYIDNILYASLYGIPKFSLGTKMVLHVFNRGGYLPPCDPACASNPPEVYAVFRDVSLPAASGGSCDYGAPFYSWGSPIVEFQVAVGSQPGLSDVKEFETLLPPCIPCLLTPCYQYGCTPTCPLAGDPSIITFTITHLALSPITNMTNRLSGSGSGSGSGDIMDSSASIPAQNTSIPIQNTTTFLKPSTYYITVHAISASGQTITASSNGVLIDITPPTLSIPIRHYDVEFSPTQPTHYQGNNHTIATSWFFEDLESGIIEYRWAIGTTPYSIDIQQFTSVGLNTQAQNTNLEGSLIHNTTYYITVEAKNGAGLSKIVTSDGITYLDLELNKTELELIIKVDYIEAIENVNIDGENKTILRTNREDKAAVEWSGVPDDISKTYWYIGSEPGYTDILPYTDVSYNNTRSASIDSGVLYFDNIEYTNISELIALVDNIDPTDVDGLYFEPGRLFFHTLEFCNFAHRCQKSDPRYAIVIRDDDGRQVSKLGEDISLTIIQNNPDSHNISVLNKNYTITLSTSGGLQRETRLFAGFLEEIDVTRQYRVNVPYISNPYDTMDQTSRDIARRFTAIGGPSFFVSFLGQDSLQGELRFNVTFDSSLDWTESDPKLAYWDIDTKVWREVKDTCGTEAKVDITTSTISVDVCSTVLSNSDTSNRPASLTRRRRALGESGEGSSGTDIEFLDRPTHFIVIQLGNFSINTAPQLQLSSQVVLQEDVPSFTYTIPYDDKEGDMVWFYLTTIPQLGTAELNRTTGLLTYIPCWNCTGIENLGIYIIERELEFGTELDDTGILQLNITNTDDPLGIFLYEKTSHNDSTIASNNTIIVYVEANRTQPVVVARVGVYDVDGYHDDLEVYVTQGTEGSSGYIRWVDMVSTAESIPVDWGVSPLVNFTGYISFLGADITYLPSSTDFTGTDVIRVYSQQEDNTFSHFLYVNIEVLPSWCSNGGVCNGSVSDPTCEDIDARRTDPNAYTCSCPPGYYGDYCEMSSIIPVEPEQSVCPDNIPLVTCNGDPCEDASCPGYPSAVCVADYCGHCHAVWYIGQDVVTCTAANPAVCHKPVIPGLSLCNSVSCDCPPQHYDCPVDSIFTETRVSDCCVTYSCVCPNISCPVLMSCGHGLQPLPEYRGGLYPGRCCPDYQFEDINECEDINTNICSDICVNEQPFFSCQCPTGKTLASDNRTCGVCEYNGIQYLHGDRVKIGCNWCICQEDDLSGERWHCTADACQPGCYFNGGYYNIGSLMILGSNNCTCNPTDSYAKWSCTFNI